jgi:alpha-tubulin suppressor-like RCC1 family protein
MLAADALTRAQRDLLDDAPAAGGLTFTAVSGGLQHSCGLTGGTNDHGQLGDGMSTNRTTAVAVLGGLSFVAVRTAPGQSRGLTAGGTGYCRGANSNGQLGNGSTADSYIPVKVAGQP